MNGYLAILLYCFITALSVLLIHDVTQQADPNVVMLYTFILCAGFFNLLNQRHAVPLYKKFIPNGYPIVWLNISTILIWLGTFWGLKYITPALFITIFMGVLPIGNSLLAIVRGHIPPRGQLLLDFIIVALIILLTYFYQFILHAKEYYLQGILFSVMGGLAVIIYMQASKKLQHDQGFSILDVLSVRFYLLILLALVLSFYYAQPGSFTYGISLLDIFLISAFSTILPLYLLQTSIHKIGPIKTGYLMPFTPIFAYLIELLYGIPFNAIIFMLIVLLSAVMILSVKIKNASERGKS